MNIVLTGPMGSGKTSIGRLLAKKLSFQFIDTDNLIETEAGINISEFFSRYGESAFRKKEEEIISLVTKKDKCVIATGGGVVLNPLNMRRLRLNGMILYSSIFSGTAANSNLPLIRIITGQSRLDLIRNNNIL